MSVKLLDNIKAVPCSDLNRMFAVPKPVAEADPLSVDQKADPLLLITERRLRRLVIVAADTGARFEREGIGHDPAAWMLAPRVMFEGARPLEACQNLAGFTRGVLLHGLSLGLDASPEEIDALIADGGDEDEFVPRSEYPNDQFASLAVTHSVELYTCHVEGPIGHDGRRAWGFCAMTAGSETVVRKRLAIRFGERLAATADVSVAFDRHDERMSRLVPAAFIDQLANIAAHPSSDDGAGLEYVVEMRSAS